MPLGQSDVVSAASWVCIVCLGYKMGVEAQQTREANRLPVPRAGLRSFIRSTDGDKEPP